MELADTQVQVLYITLKSIINSELEMLNYWFIYKWRKYRSRYPRSFSFVGKAYIFNSEILFLKKVIKKYKFFLTKQHYYIIQRK